MSSLDKNNSAELIRAATTGNYEHVMELIRKGVELDVSGKDGRTALQVASENGHSQIVELLIKKGADVNGDNEWGPTALIMAVHHGHLRIAMLLLDKGARLEATNENGWTALQVASECDRLELMELLIERGADVNGTGKRGNTAPLLICAISRNCVHTTQLLIDKGANLEATDRWGNTALVLAVKQGRLGVVRLLVERGAELEAIEKQLGTGRTALLCAVFGGHLGIVQLLVDKGANLDATDRCGDTAATLAERRGLESIVAVIAAARQCREEEAKQRALDATGIPPCPQYPDVDVIAQLGLPLRISPSNTLPSSSRARKATSRGSFAAVSYRLDTDDKEDLETFRRLGLTFNQASGEVGGIPSALHLEAPLKMRVTASNEFGDSPSQAELRLVVSSDLGLVLRSDPMLCPYESKVLNELAASVAELRACFLGDTDGLRQAANKLMAPHLGRGHKLGLVLTEVMKIGVETTTGPPATVNLPSKRVVSEPTTATRTSGAVGGESTSYGGVRYSAMVPLVVLPAVVSVAVMFLLRKS